MNNFQPSKFLLIVVLAFFSFSLSATNLYWIGGTGNWGDSNHWSTSSGGASGAVIPTSADNVFFDANSFSGAGQVVTLNVTGICADMNWTGALFAPTYNATSQDLHIYGSLTMVAGMTMNNFITYFNATSTGKTITTAGVPFSGNGAIYFNGVGGSWTFQDIFNVNREVTLENGTLNTNSQLMYCETFFASSQSSTGRILILNATSLSVEAWVDVSGNNLTVSSGTSTINLPGNGIFNAGTHVFYDVMFGVSAGTGSLTGTNFHNVIFASNAHLTSNSSMYCNSVEFQMYGLIQGSGVASFGKLKFLDNGYCAINNSYDTLICSAGKTYTIGNGTTQTVNNLFQANGNCNQPILFLSSTVGSTTSTFNSNTGNINVSYARLKDIRAIGSSSFIANNSFDDGNNTGWTINTPATQNLYWVGGIGNWNDATHWATSSGGIGSTCIPTRVDNVFFDANSFSVGNKIVTINVAAECNIMDWTGATQTPVLTGTSDLNIYGSLTFISAMSTSFTGKTYFKSTGAGNTITSAGKSFANDVHFDGANADWTLNDNFSIAGSGFLTLYLNNGYIVTNDKTLTCGNFQSTGNNTRGLYLGNSNIFTTYTDPSAQSWNVSGTNFSVDAGTSTISCTAPSGINFIGGTNNYYNNLVFSNTLYTGNVGYCGGINNVVFNCVASINAVGNVFGTVTFNKSAAFYSGANAYRRAIFMQDAFIDYNNTFDTLQLTGGNTYTLAFGTNQTINNTIITPGLCTAPVNIQTNNSGSAATLLSSSNITVNYVILKDITATGATFTANNSTNLGNNAGWTMNAPVTQNLYWVGGSGNWNDPVHWSLTQGGAGGACVPSSADNVFFTTGSFTAGSKTVTMNVAGFCKNMSWTGSAFTPVFTGSSDLNIYGSLTLITGMSFTGYTGKVYFRATIAGNTITSAGKTFNNDVMFNGVGGYWTLQDALTLSSTSSLYLNGGSLNTNGKSVTIQFFYSQLANVKQLILGTSTVTVTGVSAGYHWYVTGSNLTMLPGTSLIKFTGANNITVDGGVGSNGVNYYDVIFQNATNSSLGVGNYHNVTFFGGGNTYWSSTFHKLDFKGTANMNGNCTIDSLLFNPGFTANFTAGITVNINSYFGANGTAGNLVNLTSSGTYTINVPSCLVCCNYISLNNCHAGGGASFYAANSTNVGNNTGWNFAACPSTTLTVGPVTGPANTCVNGTNYTYSIPAVSGGTYVWSVPAGATIVSGQGTNTIYVSVGSTAGTVSVTVDACGNTASATKTITVNPNPTITNISVTPATCSNADGSATATVTGGTPTYFYRWSSGDTLATAPAIAAGQYQLVVFDTYGCRATANATIVASDGPQITIVSTTPTSCFGGANATAQISVTGGTTPYVILWSNGASALSTSGLTAGPYEVTVTDANECAASQSITISSASQITNTFAIVPSACAGATGSAQASPTGGTGAYTYLWDGAAANQTTATASTLAAGVYQVVVKDANLCQVTFTATVPNTATTLASSISNVIAGDCGPNSAGSATLDATGGAPSYNYLWSSGAVTASITGVAPGNYYCTVIDASLCASSQSVTIPSNVGNITQAICMVTVDTATFTNQVIWEKLITNDIQSFKIYRESNIQNVYTAIATVPFNNVSEFTDLVANPSIHAWRYKITAVDSCGVETPYSAPHKTIHLAQNLGVGGEINLAWDQYEGFPYYSYYIWRHDPSTGWVILDTLSTNYTTYTDFVPPSGDSRYMIDVRPQAGCSSTLRLAGGNDINTVVVKSKSNIKNNRTVGIKDSKNQETRLRVYPNPASDLLNVEVSLLKETQATITIENMLGQVVYTTQTNKQINSINTNNLISGVYFVKVNTGRGVVVEKIIIE
jgi:hypothetical protein